MKVTEFGCDGEAGKIELQQADGTVEVLKACDQTVLEVADAVIVTKPTPEDMGGGERAQKQASPENSSQTISL